MWQIMTKRVFYADDDFILILEELNEQAFVHVHLNEFSRKIFKKLLEQWKEVLMRFYLLGYEEIFTYTKDPRIVNMVGGAQKIDEHEGYEVYKWELK